MENYFVCLEIIFSCLCVFLHREAERNLCVCVWIRLLSTVLGVNTTEYNRAYFYVNMYWSSALWKMSAKYTLHLSLVTFNLSCAEVIFILTRIQSEYFHRRYLLSEFSYFICFLNVTSCHFNAIVVPFICYIPFLWLLHHFSAIYYILCHVMQFLCKTDIHSQFKYWNVMGGNFTLSATLESTHINHNSWFHSQFQKAGNLWDSTHLVVVWCRFY